MPKKVLIITYYWPPRGGAGVFRWLKFSKYLGLFGVEPIVYTPLNGEAQMMDFGLEKEVNKELKVIKQKIVEPFGLYKSFMGLKKNARLNTGFLNEGSKNQLKENFALWVRSNFFIPDARVWWVKPSVKYLANYLKQNPVDAIITTGPPHSMHLIGMQLQEKLGVKWIADFRDPWTEIDWFSKLKLTKNSLKKHKQLENQVLSKADKVVTVSPTWANNFEKNVGKKVELIYNGYDEEDFSHSPIAQKNNKEFEIIHAGSLNADRNPYNVWKGLKNLIKLGYFKEQTLKISLIGPVDFSVIESLKKLDLFQFLQHDKQIPHKEIPSRLKSANLLLLPLNNTANTKGILPGKFYEYLAAERPILATGLVDGDCANILNQSKSGFLIDFNEELTKEKWELLFKNFNPNKAYISTFSRKNLAKQYAEIINSL